MLVRHFRRISALVLAVALWLGTAQAQTQAMNILLIGVDAAPEGENGRSDAMLLVQADPEDGSIRMVSFLRDLYVSIPGVGQTRMNAAYTHGGEELLKKTIQQNFGVSIDRTVTVHFSMLTDLVDQLGGIEVEITEKEREQINRIIREHNAAGKGIGSEVPMAGVQRLDGLQTLCFSRIRKIDGDFQRTARQQAVIAAMLAQASTLTPWQLIGLAIQNLPRIQTDLSFADICALLPLVRQLGEMEIATAHVPFLGAFTEETISGMMVLRPDLNRCRRELQAFLD